VSYFKEHQGRMTYAQAEQLNELSGTGAMESTCRQYQRRFKRPGQFWTRQGDEGLLCLEAFWRNGRWSQLFLHTKNFDLSKTEMRPTIPGDLVSAGNWGPGIATFGTLFTRSR
jgi:hypothetical protein